MPRLTIPTRYEDVTLKECDAFSLAQDDYEKLEAFGNKREDIEKADAKVVFSLVERVTTMLDNPSVPPTSTRFNHNGVEYGIIPDFHKMPFGDYIDIEGTFDNIEGRYSYLATLLFKKVTQDGGKWYEVDPSRPKLEELADLPVIYLDAAFFFFSSSLAVYEASTVSYLTKMAKNQISLARNLLKDTGGIRRFMRWLGVIPRK